MDKGDPKLTNGGPPLERVSEAGDRRLEVVEAEVGKELYKRPSPDRSKRPQRL